MTPQQIRRNAAAIRDAGLPDFLNRWLTMTPQAWAENEAARSRIIKRTTMSKTETGPKESQLQALRSADATPRGAATQEAAKESAVRKTKTATKKKPAAVSIRCKTKSTNPDGPRPGSKLQIIQGLLSRKEGCTTKQILDACSWPSVSVPQQARALGVKLKKEKVDGVTVYRAA